MPSFRTLRVVEELSRRPGLQRVRLGDGSRAYALTDVVGDVAVGDEVVVNTTAVELGLGTGGWHVVHWNLARRELHLPGGGHIVKARYTSVQVDVGAVEERPGVLDAGRPDLDGLPVLVGSLHSQAGVAAALLHAVDPQQRVVYVMTDAAALPIALSDLMADLVDRRIVAATVTAGQAFGGTYEAVSVPSALQIAREVAGADVVVCAMGPGVVGTGTALGTSALEVASIVTAARRLGARPTVIIRASSGDVRPRHRGISHHTATAFALCDGGFEFVVPPELEAEARAIADDVVVDEPGDVGAVLDGLGLRITTMGRGPVHDPLFFRTVGAAVRRAVTTSDPDDTVGPHD